ncbi:hypothetical protein ACVNIS_22420 [Sphaerotilaceae bacterium SBD11-9]
MFWCGGLSRDVIAIGIGVPGCTSRIPPATTIIPSALITKENAKQFYFPDSPF